MHASAGSSPFIDVASVEAWDAWFRWRSGTTPRDASIEDTWRRVAVALAAAETNGTAIQQTRFMDALASWQLLPDARLLRTAGTRTAGWRHGALHAVLNAAAFVSSGGAGGASLTLATLGDCAALAVRMLDNAALLARIASPRLRIGIVGIADMLALLGVAYDSDAGRARAAAAARAVAEGCFRGSIELAAARRRCQSDAHTAIMRAAARDTTRELLKDAARHGLRHLQTTAISSQPRLALLANDVADAVDPLWGVGRVHVIEAPDGDRTVRSPGYALNMLRGLRGGHEDGTVRTLHDLPWTAQIAMRTAVQPWMDEAINYPLLVARKPGAHERQEASQQAALHGLGEPAWRICRELLPTA